MAVLVAALLVPGHGVAGADPSHRHGKCGQVTFDYDPARLHSGDTFDMDMTVTNCSDRFERLRVNVHFSGHCDFPHPANQTFQLDAGYGVGMSALAVAPSCPGRYTAHIRLTLAGRHYHPVLDTAGDGFFVERD